MRRCKRCGLIAYKKMVETHVIFAFDWDDVFFPTSNFEDSESETSFREYANFSELPESTQAELSELQKEAIILLKEANRIGSSMMLIEDEDDAMNRMEKYMPELWEFCKDINNVALVPSGKNKIKGAQTWKCLAVMDKISEKRSITQNILVTALGSGTEWYEIEATIPALLNTVPGLVNSVPVDLLPYGLSKPSITELTGELQKAKKKLVKNRMLLEHPPSPTQAQLDVMNYKGKLDMIYALDWDEVLFPTSHFRMEDICEKYATIDDFPDNLKEEMSLFQSKAILLLGKLRQDGVPLIMVEKIEQAKEYSKRFMPGFWEFMTKEEKIRVEKKVKNRNIRSWKTLTILDACSKIEDKSLTRVVCIGGDIYWHPVSNRISKLLFQVDVKYIPQRVRAASPDKLAGQIDKILKILDILLYRNVQEHGINGIVVPMSTK